MSAFYLQSKNRININYSSIKQLRVDWNQLHRTHLPYTVPSKETNKSHTKRQCRVDDFPWLCQGYVSCVVRYKCSLSHSKCHGLGWKMPCSPWKWQLFVNVYDTWIGGLKRYNRYNGITIRSIVFWVFLVWVYQAIWTNEEAKTKKNKLSSFLFGKVNGNEPTFNNSVLTLLELHLLFQAWLQLYQL